MAIIKAKHSRLVYKQAMPAPTDLARTQRFSWMGWFAFALMVTLIAAAYCVYSGAIRVDDRFNPWAPLDVTASPNFLTDLKLWRARSKPTLCLAALETSGANFDVLPDRDTGPGCGFENAVLLRKAGVQMGSALSLSCPLALSLTMWERHTLQPAAQRQFGQRVVALEQMGSYACRNINQGGPSTSRQRSRHATANALDIAGLTLANGKRISVLQHWPGTHPARANSADAKLLADAHEGACRFFDGVLGPDYNAVHRDHFHLETGGFGMCR